MLTPRKLQSRPMRQEWKPTPRNERPLAPATPSRALVRGTYAGRSSGKAVEKAERADPRGEQAHKAALVGLGCMACRRLFPWLAPGPVELHHLRGGGWGKGDYETLFGLCYPHHRGHVGIHTLGTKAWERKFGFTQADLLMDALEMINGKQ